jgi:hypothetical protein
MATVTPTKKESKRPKAESASKQTGGYSVSGSGSKQGIRIDVRLETARPVLESQPSNLIVPISDASIAMLSASAGIRSKQKGASKLDANDDLFPQSINFQPKFDAPEDLLNNDETKKDADEFNKLIKDTKIKAKKLIVKQAFRTVRHLEEKRRVMFIKTVTTLAGHYATYHRTLHIVPLDTRGLTDAYVGSTSLYCYINGLDKDSVLFEYLFTDKDAFMPRLKDETTKSATGAAIFADVALNEITTSLKIGTEMTVAQVNLLPDPNDDSDDASSQATVLPAPRNLHCGQPTGTMEVENTQEEEANPFDIPGNRRLITTTADSLIEMLIPVFCNVDKEMAMVHQKKVADATLGAAIKKAKNLNLAKEIQQTIDTETSVQPKNMEAVVSLQANKIWDQKQKSLLKELRKNTLGGATVTATNPDVQSNGEASKKPSKKNKQVTWNKSTDKKVNKKQFTSKQQKGKNPYPTNQKSNKSYHSQHYQGRGGRGRGQGRGRGRGSRGRGRSRDG